MKVIVYALLIILMMWFVWVFFISDIHADFVPSDKPSFDVSTNGNGEHQNIVFSGTLPIKSISGYVGVQYWRSGSLLGGTEGDDIGTSHIKARAEGGYHHGRFGIRGYARYGRESVMLQDALWHGGVYLHIDILKKDKVSIDTGIGTWIEKEDLLEEYRDTETIYETKSGLRGHLQARYKTFNVLAEVLPVHDFKSFSVRILPSFEVPLAKVLFVEQLSTVITGTITYQSETGHVDIDNWQYNWKHALKWEF